MKSITAKKLSQSLGISHNLAGKYLRGYCKPNLTRAVEIERKLGIPVHAWLDIKAYLNHTPQPAATSSAAGAENPPKERV